MILPLRGRRARARLRGQSVRIVPQSAGVVEVVELDGGVLAAEVERGEVGVPGEGEDVA